MKRTSKKQQAKNAYLAGDIKSAFKILKSFRSIIPKSQQHIIAIHTEVLTGNAAFYKSIGKDLEGIEKEAIQIAEAILL